MTDMRKIQIEMSDEEYAEYKKHRYLTNREHLLTHVGVRTDRRKAGRKKSFKFDKEKPKDINLQKMYRHGKPESDEARKLRLKIEAKTKADNEERKRRITKATLKGLRGTGKDYRDVGVKVRCPNCAHRWTTFMYNHCWCENCGFHVHISSAATFEAAAGQVELVQKDQRERVRLETIRLTREAEKRIRGG